jgi:hypothetical protein
MKRRNDLRDAGGNTDRNVEHADDFKEWSANHDFGRRQDSAPSTGIAVIDYSPIPVQVRDEYQRQTRWILFA